MKEIQFWRNIDDACGFLNKLDYSDLSDIDIRICGESALNDLSRLVDVINSNNTNDGLRVSGHVDVSEKETKIYLIAVKKEDILFKIH